MQLRLLRAGQDQEIASTPTSKFGFHEGLRDMTYNVIMSCGDARGCTPDLELGLDDLVGIRPSVLYEKYDSNFSSTP